MSPRLVTALFVLFTVASLRTFVHAADEAFADPTLRTLLVAWFWLFKTAIVAAFSYFVFVRPPSRRQTRGGGRDRRVRGRDGGCRRATRAVGRRSAVDAHRR